LDEADHVHVLDDVIAAALVAVIVELHGLAAHVADEAGFRAPLSLMQLHQPRAEIRFEYVGQDEDGRLHFEAPEARGRRPRPDEAYALGGIASVLDERDDPQDAQGRVEDDPDPAQGDRPGGDVRIVRNGAVEPADMSIEIPEEAEAWHASGHALPRLVSR